MQSFLDVPKFTDKMIGDFPDETLAILVRDIEKQARTREEQARACLQFAAKLHKEIERRAAEKK